MEMIDYITLAVFFVAGWYVGHKLAVGFYLRLFKMILEDLGIDNKKLVEMARKHGAEFITPEHEAKFKEIEEADLEKIEIKVEKHNDTLYAFRKDNDAFLGQGATREDLIEAMAQKMKNVHLTVVEGNEYMKSEA